MKKRIKIWGIFLCILISFTLVSENVRGEIDWTVLQQINLNAKPTDVAISEDGRMIFVLTPGEIVVYAPSNNKIENRIPVDKEFDRITYSGKSNTLVLTSNSSKTLRIIRVDQIYNIDISGLPFKGSANAPVTIAVFDDYQWPYCARLEPIFQQVLKKYPNEVKLVIKHFPLRNHKFAMKAATAALAANEQGKFWEFHHELFKNYNALNDSKIQDIVKQLNLDMEKFNRDMNSPVIANLINRDLNNGRQIGIRGTPTIFVNGKLLEKGGVSGFSEMIESELKRKG